MARRLKPPPAKDAPAPARDAALDAFMDQANGAGRTAAPKVKSPQQKFLDVLKIMDQALIEREEETRLVLTALLSRHHTLLVGPPGTAKSLVVESIRRWIAGAKSCTLHCNKDTTRTAAFGPVKMSSLKADRYERVLDGGLADADLAVFEEVFKSGPAVLDMFLLLLNERIYKEGAFSTRCPLITALAVSNEWSPDGCEAALAAFFDRFVLRKKVDYVSDAGRDELLRRAVYDDAFGEVAFPEQISLAEVGQAQQEVRKLPWTDDAFQALRDILSDLKKQSIHPGDRRVAWSARVARAAAYLAGADEVCPEHLEVLSHVLWVAPENAKQCEKVVLHTANSLKVEIMDDQVEVLDAVAKAEDRLKAATDQQERSTICTETVNKLKDAYRKMNNKRQSPLRDKALATINLLGKEWKRRLLPGAAQD